MIKSAGSSCGVVVVSGARTSSLSDVIDISALFSMDVDEFWSLR